MRVVLWLAALLVVALIVVSALRVDGLYCYKIRVIATMVDAVSQVPLAAATVLTLPSSAYRERLDWIATERRRHLEDPTYGAWGRSAVGVSDLRGHVALVVQVFRSRTGVWPWKRQLDPCDGVGAVLVELDGYEPRVIECQAGEWTGEGEDVDAAWDLGIVHLRRKAD